MLQKNYTVTHCHSAKFISRTASLFLALIFISIIGIRPLNAQHTGPQLDKAALAQKMYDDGRYKTRSNSEEVAHYTKILQLYPEFKDAHLELGFARLRMKSHYDSPNYKQISREGYKQALQNFTKAIRLLEKNAYDLPSAYYGRGVSWAGLGRYKAAIEDFTKAIELKDRSAYLYEQRGLAFQKLGDIQNAVADYMTAAQHNRIKESYTRVIKIDPDFAEAYYQRGLIFLQQGYDHEDDGIRDEEYFPKDKAVESLKRAIFDFNEVTRLKPDFFDAYFKRGLARVALGERLAGVEEANKALRIHSDSAQAYYQRGMALHKLGKRNEAIEDLSKAISIDHRLADAYLQRGIVYAEMKNYRKAIEDFTRPIRIKRFNPLLTERDFYNQNDNKHTKEELNLLRQLLYNRAQSLIAIGDQQKALYDLNWLIDGLLPWGVDEAYSLRGKIRSSIGDERGAHEDFETITRNYYLREMRNISENSSEKAFLRAFNLSNKAKEINPNQPCVYYFSGELYERYGNDEKALGEYTLGILVDSRVSDLYYARSRINEKLGNLEKLVEDYSNLIGVDPDRFLVLRGDAYLKLGNRKKAVEDYSKALIGNGYSFSSEGDYCAEYMGIAFHKSMPYHQDGRHRRARLYYKIGLAITNANTHEASQALQNSLDIFTELGDLEWQQKVRIALDSIK